MSENETVLDKTSKLHEEIDKITAEMAALAARRLSLIKQIYDLSGMTVITAGKEKPDAG